MKKVFAVSSLVVAFIMLCTAYAQGSLIQNRLNFNDFGLVWNTDTGLPGGNSVNWCAPTATINSFRFLENSNPGIYGTSLTGEGAEIFASRNALKGLMQSNAGGTTDQNWWEGKIKWIEERKPGVTVYGGMVDSSIDFSTWNYNQWLLPGLPTWGWLWTQLADKEDVELKIVPISGDPHALTLTGLYFQDTNGNDVWDTGETRGINYLDPNNPTQPFSAALNLNPAGALSFVWNNGGIDQNQPVYISMAFKESVPEPCSVIALAVGLVSLLGLRRRRA